MGNHCLWFFWILKVNSTRFAILANVLYIIMFCLNFIYSLILILIKLFHSGFAASNISEVYDAKIFAVTTILSSYLIYNSVKVCSCSLYLFVFWLLRLALSTYQIIDQGDLDYLDLLARRTRVSQTNMHLNYQKSTWMCVYLLLIALCSEVSNNKVKMVEWFQPWPLTVPSPHLGTVLKMIYQFFFPKHLYIYRLFRISFRLQMTRRPLKNGYIG